MAEFLDRRQWADSGRDRRFILCHSRGAARWQRSLRSSWRKQRSRFMLKFSSSGQYLTEFDFGWDDTPAVYSHDGTYSVITKDNHYESRGPYYITQLNADLGIEWQYQSVDNYEWCVNAPAVDKNGTVYADSEDGNVFVINQGGSLKGKLFLQSAVGAAYTPIAIGRDGKIYTENDGNMFVVGTSAGK